VNVASDICGTFGCWICIRCMSTEIRVEQRQAILAILVSLVVCGVLSGAEANLIDRASPVAGNLTFALAVYRNFDFCHAFIPGACAGAARYRPALAGAHSVERDGLIGLGFGISACEVVCPERSGICPRLSTRRFDSVAVARIAARFQRHPKESRF